MSAAPPRRRWFQFGLGTMLAAVTLFACWLGYELNWIRERHDFLAREQARHEAQWPQDRRDDSTRWWKVQMDGSPKPAPGLLWLFGERPVRSLLVTIPMEDIKVSLRPDPNQDDLEFTRLEMLRSQPDYRKALRLFPEAEVTPMRWDDDVPTPEFGRMFHAIQILPASESK